MSEKLLDNLKRDRNKKPQSSEKTKRLVMRDEGKYKMRILPNKNDKDGLPYERVFLHFGFNHPNYNNPGTFRCLGKDCPLCREAKKMKEEGNVSAWRYRSTPVFLYYVYDNSDNFRFLRLSQTAHNQLIDEITALVVAKINPLDIEKGRHLEIKLTKEAKKNVYKCTFMNEVSSVPYEIRSELNSAQELGDIYRRYTKEELEKVLKGEKLIYGSDKSAKTEDAEDTYEDEEASKPSPTSRRVVDSEDEEPIDSSAEVEEIKARIRKQLGE